MHTLRVTQCWPIPGSVHVAAACRVPRAACLRPSLRLRAAADANEICAPESPRARLVPARAIISLGVLPCSVRSAGRASSPPPCPHPSVRPPPRRHPRRRRHPFPDRHFSFLLDLRRETDITKRRTKEDAKRCVDEAVCKHHVFAVIAVVCRTKALRRSCVSPQSRAIHCCAGSVARRVAHKV